GLAARVEASGVHGEEARIQRLYELVFQRSPDADELALGRKFLASQAEPPEPAPPPWSYGYGQYEETSRRVTEFTPLPHWTGYAWQGGTNLPDPKLGWVILNADGGHVGNDQNHAAIRRWRAPRDLVVSIRGELNHPSDKGDGVRARIVSSAQGLLGEWTARHERVATGLDRVAVKRGEWIDFVADCRQSVEFDSFHWAPALHAEVKPGAGSKPTEETTEWNAKNDFSGPAKPKERRALSAWEKYAQVLLLANET